MVESEKDKGEALVEQHAIGSTFLATFFRETDIYHLEFSCNSRSSLGPIWRLTILNLAVTSK